MKPSVRLFGLGLILALNPGCTSTTAMTTDATSGTTDGETTEDATTDTTVLPVTETGSESDTVNTSDTGSESEDTLVDTDSDTDSETTDSETSESESESESETTTEPVNCGNGELDQGEDCDGTEFAVTSCLAVDEVFKGGDLACNEDCTYNTDSCIQCLAPTHIPCDHLSDSPFNALELNCQEHGGEWDATNSTPTIAPSMVSPDTNAWRVAKQFGSHMINENTPAFGPTAGEHFLLLSTGLFAAEEQNGYIEKPPGSAKTGMTNNENPSGNTLFPGIMSTAAGGSSPFIDCDGDNDCSNTLITHWEDGTLANDVLYTQFDVQVPEGTEGFEFDFAFFSAELQYLDSPFNDVALVWMSGDEYTGNLTYLYDQNSPIPMTLTSLDSLGMLKYSSNDPELKMTGFDNVGTSTGWLTARGPAVGGEKITISIAVLDKDDAFLDTALALDNFRWTCEGCELGIPDLDSCGVVMD